jgi:ankyrin repeat protein
LECQFNIEQNMEATCAGVKERLASGGGSLDRQLWQTCAVVSLGAVEALLQEGANPNFVAAGVSCLQTASGNGHVSVVQALLAAGAHIDADCGDEYSMTALHVAAGNGYSDVVKVLVEAGANVSIRNSSGCSPLDTARIYGHTAVANYLAAAEKRAAAAAEEAREQAAAEANKATAAALAAAEAAAQQAFAELMLEEEGGQQTGAGGKGTGAKAKAKGGK